MTKVGIVPLRLTCELQGIAFRSQKNRSFRRCLPFNLEADFDESKLCNKVSGFQNLLLCCGSALAAAPMTPAVL